MAPTWQERADVLLDNLTAVGIAATMDPRKVNPPCALVVPPALERVTGKGLWTAWTVHLVAPGANDLDAATWLMDNVEAAMEAVGAQTAEYVSLTLDPERPPFPAYTLNVIAQGNTRGTTP